MTGTSSSQITAPSSAFAAVAPGGNGTSTADPAVSVEYAATKKSKTVAALVHDFIEQHQADGSPPPTENDVLNLLVAISFANDTQKTLKDRVKEQIRQHAFDEAHGNISDAAKLVGIQRPNFYRERRKDAARQAARAAAAVTTDTVPALE